ncbi:16S rRNA (cytosine(1402)-N(4))-methyltransferase [Listeria newyorkensis]|uniref:16S rRNA (Cytosine(1402)-N(4))-methyltransferase n=1 Tax=Listeria newyorkensis TaxID=1497681 RepID=A0ABX4XM82_9LIST|nr:class I SAM-dependent methyltransferase [Listeria newyorkensis]KGL46594.1 rRNA methyltransferase [Listeria newyorkensis]PNP91063.1 16S rRNA (cytosine(1402)-N(4))-methyltransferase [Listeria newyorkensis]WAO20852.1 class I SAM-dependent methyltransferase [Listeria newyorkensis]SQC56291.1 16S rRNA m(4)C1402 methyltranserfase [Listeria newyorkensis]
MNLKSILPFSHDLLTRIILPGDTVVDATIGNGHDTVFLADLVGVNGRVFGFDIQQEAIDATTQLLTEKRVASQVTLLHESHANMAELLPQQTEIKVAIFNLGYLPGGDKTITTLADSTIKAINAALSLLTVGGIVILVIYHGHPEGQSEKAAVLNYAEALPQEQFHVLEYRFINQRNNPPFVIAIEKRKTKPVPTK